MERDRGIFLEGKMGGIGIPQEAARGALQGPQGSRGPCRGLGAPIGPYRPL